VKSDAADFATRRIGHSRSHAAGRWAQSFPWPITLVVFTPPAVRPISSDSWSANVVAAAWQAIVVEIGRVPAASLRRREERGRHALLP
jgi:hypothetical protein